MTKYADLIDGTFFVWKDEVEGRSASKLLLKVSNEVYRMFSSTMENGGIVTELVPPECRERTTEFVELNSINAAQPTTFKCTYRQLASGSFFVWCGEKLEGKVFLKVNDDSYKCLSEKNPYGRRIRALLDDKQRDVSLVVISSVAFTVKELAGNK